ncbi:MAG: FIST N-terminal domain-containing protein, partial [Thermoanaerobaculia bacterium]
VTGLALSSSKVARAAVRLVRFDVEGVDAGIRGAAASLAAELKMRSLREADPHRYVGIVLFDGINGREEEANEVLGNIAPTLSFVGGSAGDGLEFRATKVYCNDVASEHGAALLLIDSAVPFTVIEDVQLRSRGASVAGDAR